MRAGKLGLVAGAMVGVALYAGLSRIAAQKLFAATNVLIALLAASVASQRARAPMQAGLLEHGSAPLWDSWSSQPSAVQIGFHVTVLAGICLGTRLVMRQLRMNAPIHRTNPA